ncbi:hypothetical protein BC628DRAFT_418771 [Trametes gibbosa]|nr:hypothetical protein BC628DRAFT_418771 [Trametes gibbosa]
MATPSSTAEGLRNNVTPADLMCQMGTMSISSTPSLGDVDETQKPGTPYETEGHVPAAEWNFANDRWLPAPDDDSLLPHSGWFPPTDGGWTAPDNEQHVLDPPRSHRPRASHYPAARSVASSSRQPSAPGGSTSTHQPLSSATDARRSKRLHVPPPSSLEVPKLPGTRYSLSLPPDTDIEFKLSVSVNGKRGLSLDCPGLSVNGRLNSTIARAVDGASHIMEHYFLDGTIFTQRAYFAGEPVELPPSRSSLMPAKFTMGHLLTLLAQKQWRHWQKTAPQWHGQLDLQRLVGRETAPTPGILVPPSAIYIVAIRRRASRKGGWCYFPELEVHV